MVNLAEFFNVSVGYLTGETDHESFEMENVCAFLGLEENGVKAIKGITSGKNMGFDGKYRGDEYKSVLQHILTSRSFTAFIKKLENMWKIFIPVNKST